MTPPQGSVFWVKELAGRAVVWVIGIARDLINDFTVMTVTAGWSACLPDAPTGAVVRIGVVEQHRQVITVQQGLLTLLGAHTGVHRRIRAHDQYFIQFRSCALRLHHCVVKREAEGGGGGEVLCSRHDRQFLSCWLLYCTVMAVAAVLLLLS